MLTMFDPRNNLAHQVAEEVKRHFRVFDSVIPRNVRLSEAPSHGKPALLYDVQSKGAQGYLSLARELLAGEATPRRAARPRNERARTKRRALGRGLDALLPAAPPRRRATATRASSPARSRRSSRRRGSRGSTSTRRSSTSSRRASASTGSSSRWSCGACPARDKFELIAGERRWRALQRAGLREALVVVKDVSAEGRVRARAHRERPARGPERHRARRGATTGSCASTATRRRRSPSASARTARRSPTSSACSSCPPRVRREGRRRASSARATRARCSARATRRVIEQLAEKVVRGGLSVRATEALVRSQAEARRRRQGAKDAGARAPACAISSSA